MVKRAAENPDPDHRWLDHYVVNLPDAPSPGPPIHVYLSWDRVVLEVLQLVVHHYKGLPPRFRMWDTALRLLLEAMGVLEEPNFSVERLVLQLYPGQDLAPSHSRGLIDTLINLGARERRHEFSFRGPLFHGLVSASPREALTHDEAPGGHQQHLVRPGIDF